MRFGTFRVAVDGAEASALTITGRWSGDPPKKYPDGRRAGHDAQLERLLTDFANWKNDADEIVRFTTQYGPLTIPATAEGDEFSFDVRDWQRCQSDFRIEWERSGDWGEDAERDLSLSVEPKEGDEFDRKPDGLVYRVDTLHRMLRLQLLATPSNRLKKCLRPGCTAPYFIARHLGQRYCTPDCSRWAQRQLKRRWWDQKGRALRQQQHSRRTRPRTRRK